MDFGRIQPQSNRATLERRVMVVDDSNGDPLDLTGKTIVVEIRPSYGIWPSSYGVYTDDPAVLSATTDNGKITIVDIGVFQVRFERSEMTGLCPGTYRVGATISDDDNTQQAIIDTISIVAGVVAR